MYFHQRSSFIFTFSELVSPAISFIQCLIDALWHSYILFSVCDIYCIGKRFDEVHQASFFFFFCCFVVWQTYNFTCFHCSCSCTHFMWFYGGILCVLICTWNCFLSLAALHTILCSGYMITYGSDIYSQHLIIPFFNVFVSAFILLSFIVAFWLFNILKMSA